MSRIPDETPLVEAALAARAHAYAPYSGFRVGAALRAADGQVFTGANVENATYGLTVCAERTAVLKAVTSGCRAFTAIAVVTDGTEPAVPCGICRQTLYEFADGPEAAARLEIVLVNLQGRKRYYRLDELFPCGFGPSDLLDAGPPEE